MLVHDIMCGMKMGTVQKERMWIQKLPKHSTPSELKPPMLPYLVICTTFMPCRSGGDVGRYWWGRLLLLGIRGLWLGEKRGGCGCIVGGFGEVGVEYM